MDDSKEFFIMDFVVAFSRLQGLGMVGNGMPPIQGIRLFEDGPCSKIAGICDQLERFTVIRESKHRCCGEYLDEGTESRFLGGMPLERDVLLGEVEQGACYARKIFDETLIEVAKTKKGLNLFDSSWGGPISDSSHFSWVHGNMTIPDNNSKAFNGCLGKDTFFWFEIEVILFKA